MKQDLNIKYVLFGLVFLIPSFLFVEYATARIIVINGNKYTYLRPEAVAFIFLSIFNLLLFVFLNFGLLDKLKNGKIIKGVILNEIALPLFGMGAVGLWRAAKLIAHGLTNNLYSELHHDQLLYLGVLIFVSSLSIILSLHRNNKFISEYKTQLILNEKQGLSESTDSTLRAKNASLKAQLEQQVQQIADLQSQIENLKKPDTQAVENGGNVDILEYVGEIPPSTDRDKLRDFIELIAHDDFIENGKLISYSRIHTKLTSKHKNKSIPSKNTIGKYINEVQ